MDVDVDIFKS